MDAVRLICNPYNLIEPTLCDDSLTVVIPVGIEFTVDILIYETAMLHISPELVEICRYGFYRPPAFSFI